MMIRGRGAELLKLLVGERNGAGIKPTIARTSKHFQISWQVNGHRRVLTVSSSPKKSAFPPTRARLRRLLRHDGMIKNEGHKQMRKSRKQEIAPEDLPDDTPE
jgi:hypothetical protein